MRGTRKDPKTGAEVTGTTVIRKGYQRFIPDKLPRQKKPSVRR